MSSDIGILGLGVMGKSLARNFASRGFKVSVYNLPLKGEEKVVSEFVETYNLADFYGASDLNDFIQSLNKARVILLMVKSGDVIDTLIDMIQDKLDAGDIIIDAGNSNFRDTIRRVEYVKAKQIHFVGMGVSGGEEGALNGPSIMPAGEEKVQERLLPMLQKIAAIADNEACVSWLSTDGAGHFVKMVHNGIEYADMQILSELYNISKRVLGYSNEEISDLFESWQSTILKSYLTEITIDILRFKEEDETVLDEILDVAGHKGTGQWTVTEAMITGVAIPTIAAAMNQRIISAHKDLRRKLSSKLPLSEPNIHEDLSPETLKGALIFARLVALAEGLHMISEASALHNWDLNLSEVTRIWRGGCIIRSEMLIPIKDGFKNNKSILHIFQIPEIADLLRKHLSDINQLQAALLKTNISIPALSASLQYYKSMHSEFLPINLIQAQRDYFGAHTYRRIDAPDDPIHTIWKS